MPLWASASANRCDMFRHRREIRERLRRANRKEYDLLVHEAKLTPREASVLSDFILHEKSVGDIASRMECGGTLVRKLLTKAYDKIAERTTFA